ncbi:MAG: helix-turn-helix domain-containing protein [Candidatus Binatia bacterium]
MNPRRPSTVTRARRGRRAPTAAAATRARVLRQAERMFARRGYGATSLREVAAASGVRLFTIQHHFGSKAQLFEAVMSRWDAEVEALVGAVLAAAPADQVIERVVDALFDFFQARRDRVALHARAAFGEGPARRKAQGDRGWVRFITRQGAAHGLGDGGLDPGLLLITVEGVLHNHVLATPHYRMLFGRNVTDPRVAARVKRHLQTVLRALMAAGDVERRASARPAPRLPRPPGRPRTPLCTS